MNRKAVFILLLCFALTLAALILKNGQVLLFMLPLSLFLFSGAVRIPVDPDLTVERTVQLNQQNLIEVCIQLKNNGQQPLCYTLEDSPSLPLEAREDVTAQTQMLEAGQSGEIKIEYLTKRGVYRWKKLHLTVKDPLDLFEQPLNLPAPAQLKIKPVTVRLRHIPIYPRKTLHLTGNIPARLAGSGTDMWGVREYQPGDRLQRLNWRKIARDPKRLFTNEYEQEEITDIGLILDARTLGNPPAIEKELLEHAVSAAASIAEQFLREGNRVGLLVFGNRIIHLFPGYGKVQLNKIVWQLASVELRPYISLNQLSYLPFHMFSNRAQVFMISAYNTLDLHGYTQLRAYGYPLILLSPDPVAQLQNETEPQKIARQAARLERHLQLEQLTRLGVQVINWQVEQPLNTVLQTALSGVKKMGVVGERLS